MTTVVNTPSNGESTGSGFIIGIGFMVVIALGLFFIYGLPALKNRSNANANPINVNVQLPATTKQP